MISDTLFKKIVSYAVKHSANSRLEYVRRKNNPDKLFINCLNGKIAEYCFYFILKNKGYIFSGEPDLNIYNSKNKYHNSDLVCIGFNNKKFKEQKHIHVKSVSQESFKKHGISFLVEKNSSILERKTKNDFYAVMKQENFLNYSIYKIISTQDVTYSKPRLNLTTKLAVYL